jgi:hypothetical protein
VRCQVQAALGQGAFAVAEGGLNHQQGHVQLVQAGRQGGLAARKTGGNRSPAVLTLPCQLRAMPVLNSASASSHSEFLNDL